VLWSGSAGSQTPTLHANSLGSPQTSPARSLMPIGCCRIASQLGGARILSRFLLYLRKSAFISGCSVYLMTAVLLRSKVSATLTMMTRPSILCWK